MFFIKARNGGLLKAEFWNKLDMEQDRSSVVVFTV